jgi:hypothetical protein
MRDEGLSLGNDGVEREIGLFLPPSELLEEGQGRFTVLVSFQKRVIRDNR